MASCVAQFNKIAIQKEFELAVILVLFLSIFGLSTMHYIAFSQSLPYHIHEIYP